ncbi:hypothetical protein DVA67_013910 [Solirubrobacter sp. CPCC 204708]|uniref:DUF4192 family protein n=1 Tax=Solirubrobacter deserti TaxID=2282478 RepID=A0ABT4RBZ7_9ACTN|nr:hypothetical protein [Solirubrobacter deserti]MBE2317072.1 hypothetical protein [Solirubrobacter deserti]MDA0136036.1 hypothetical protein [Solirubrobacter deserti]
MTTAEWQQADREALPAWLDLHGQARRMPAGADSRLLAETALAHVLPLLDELPEDVPFVGVHAPTKPSAQTLEPWLEQVEAARGTPESGTLLAAGVELGLLGVDPDADARAAAVIVEGFELDTVQHALTEIGRQALLDPLIGSVAEQLADRVATDVSLRPRLRELCQNDAAIVALKQRATAHPSLAVMSVYLWAVVDRYPERRAQSAKTLLMLDPHAVADVRALWGEDGPSTKDEYAELLRVFHDAERRPPELDVKRAQALLMEQPLDGELDKGDPLALALRGLPNHLELPAYCAWYAAARRPGPTHRFDAWGRIAARALAPTHDVPPLRAEELLQIVARELVSPQTLDGYFDAIERLRDATGHQRFDEALAFALTNALHEADDPLELLAVTFSIWSKAPSGGQTLHDQILAPAARPYRRGDDEVRAHLGPRRQAEWDEFTARHSKPRRFLPRLRGRVR